MEASTEVSPCDGGRDVTDGIADVLPLNFMKPHPSPEASTTGRPQTASDTLLAMETRRILNVEPIRFPPKNCILYSYIPSSEPF